MITAARLYRKKLFTARAEVKMPFNYLGYHWEVVLTMQQQQARDVERAFGLDPGEQRHY